MFDISRKHGMLSCLLTTIAACAVVLGPVLPTVEAAGCYTSQVVAAFSRGPCPVCINYTCVSFTIAQNEYTRCFGVAVGESGRVICDDFPFTLVGYDYPCALKTDWLCIASYLLGCPGCTLACAGTAVECAQCLMPCIGLPPGACLCHSCGPDQNARIPILRAIFDKLRGCNCVG